MSTWENHSPRITFITQTQKEKAVTTIGKGPIWKNKNTIMLLLCNKYKYWQKKIIFFDHPLLLVWCLFGTAHLLSKQFSLPHDVEGLLELAHLFYKLQNLTAMTILDSICIWYKRFLCTEHVTNCLFFFLLVNVENTFVYQIQIYWTKLFSSLSPPSFTVFIWSDTLLFFE